MTRKTKNGQFVETFNISTFNVNHSWLTATAQSGYTGTSYLQPLPDLDVLVPTDAISSSPKVAYPVNFTTPGTYTIWLRGYANSAGGDSVYVGLGSQVVDVTGFTFEARLKIWRFQA